ncbi:putative 2-haloalkanoic acid dehalogenase [Aspergillus ellipticus CBS 707.79]|uniref:Putative 2-haloalkanoic acid dehalogenase n=1 Tax=Aspergillus ellipticus CBS 707.79 TaxID=1448320 RepID=A0A319D4B5_9EURO|nr:putative 2-haloalkanoic acid dehalogenase [Aspergillus ellipticus CBS 707.79]
MSSQKHIVFDVVGTCVSFDAFFAAIDATIGPRLRAHTITPKFFGFAWMQVAELESTQLLMSGRYTPYADVFRAVFYRVLFMAGISDPRAFATDDERDRCHAGYSRLGLRPGCSAMMDKLRENGFTVWCLTTGDPGRVGGYFTRAGINMPTENLVSCFTFMAHDSNAGAGESASLGVTKPSMGAYKPMLDRFASEDQKWFAAAHMWDVSAAVKAGFRGAYCSVLEKEPCVEIFNTKMDVTADTFEEMTDKIIAMAS